MYLSINPSSSIFSCQSINRPLPFRKYQYIIAADPGAGISPCFICIDQFKDIVNGCTQIVGKGKLWVRQIVLTSIIYL